MWFSFAFVCDFGHELGRKADLIDGDFWLMVVSIAGVAAEEHFRGSDI